MTNISSTSNILFYICYYHCCCVLLVLHGANLVSAERIYTHAINVNKFSNVEVNSWCNPFNLIVYNVQCRYLLLMNKWTWKTNKSIVVTLIVINNVYTIQFTMYTYIIYYITELSNKHYTIGLRIGWSCWLRFFYQCLNWTVFFYSLDSQFK